MNKIIAVEEITSGIVGEKIMTHDVITSPNQPMIAGLSQNDLVTLNNLLEALVSATGGGVDVLIEAGTAYPTIITNGAEFTTKVLRPMVTATISSDSVTDTNNGTEPFIVNYIFTDATKTVLSGIELVGLFNTSGFTDVDTWVRVV